MTASVRLFAFVESASPRTRHFLGMPPIRVGEADTRTEMSVANVVLQIQDQPGYSIDRYTTDGRRAGDTWLGTLEDAYSQVAFEYGVTDGSWRSVPADIDDAVAYVVSAALRKAEMRHDQAIEDLEQS
jgi:hypothetical protein